MFLYIHPVGCGRLADLVALDRTGNLDLPAEEKEFLGQCRLTGIRVGDDGERSPAFYFVHLLLFGELMELKSQAGSFSSGMYWK